jgi:hypothetical protein
MTCLPDGDVNQNGQITPADALLAFEHFLGVAEPPLDSCQQARANVDTPETSNVTPADALCIFQMFLSLPSCLDDTNGDDHGNSLAMATRIEPNTSTVGVLEIGSDRDAFRIELLIDGLLVIETTGDTDTVGTLFNASGEELATDDDSGADSNFSISQVLPAGTYFVIVTGFNDATVGTYTLNIRDVNPGTVSGVLSVGEGVVLDGDTNDPNDRWLTMTPWRVAARRLLCPRL